MNESIACPACGKRFAARPELLGRQVCCPGCREPFTARLEQDRLPPTNPFDTEPAASALVAPPPPPHLDLGRSTRGATPNPTTAPSAADRAEQAHAQATAFRIGLRLLVVGAVALLLPALGLKPSSRSLANVGTTTAAVLVTVGAALCALGKSTFGGPVLVRLGRWGQRLVLIVLIGFLALLVLALALVYFVTNSSKSNRAGPTPAATRPPQPNLGRSYRPDPATIGTYDQLVREYGAERVVRVRVTVDRAEAWGETGILASIGGAMKKSAGAKSAGWSSAGVKGYVQGGPINDLDALVKALPVDPARVSVDRVERIVTIDLGVKPATE